MIELLDLDNSEHQELMLSDLEIISLPLPGQARFKRGIYQTIPETLYFVRRDKGRKNHNVILQAYRCF